MDRQLTRAAALRFSRLAALWSAGCLPLSCLAFGGVASVNDCTSFTTCTAAVGSSVSVYSGYNASVTGFLESAALDFDFLADTMYVVTGQLLVTAYDGREMDLFNTARLGNLVISGGAQMQTLSGHNYTTTSAVPEPNSLALWLLGLAGIAGRTRRHGAVGG
jgi:hypothetical protein